MALTLTDLTTFASEELEIASAHAKSITDPANCADVLADMNTHISAAQTALALLRAFASKRLGRGIK